MTRKDAPVSIQRMCSALFGVAAGLLIGCNGPSPPDPSDPAAGRALLEKSLEAWKRGDTVDAFKQAEPSLTVIEWSWKKGGKLVNYEIQNDPEHFGYDVRFKVKLTVQEPGGSAKQQKALYNVCTTPALVVKRAEGGW